MSKPSHVLALLALAVAAAGPVLPQAAGADALLAAARDGEAERVRELLDAGVDVDATNPYGATALIFAAMHGHAEVVGLLLEHGADVDVRDGFYEFTPLAAAAFNGHRQVTLRILEAGPTETAPAVGAAIREADLDLARRALAVGPLDARTRDGLVQQARRAGAGEIAALLEEATVREVAAPDLDAEALARYAGIYQSPADESTVRVRSGDSTLELDGGDAVTLRAVAPDAFESEDGAVSVAFGGRGGQIERMLVTRGQETAFYVPVSAEELAAAAPRAGRAVIDHEYGPDPRATPGRWPAFRGSNAAGVGDGAGVPARWDVDSGDNVRWRTPIPGLANSSPVIWEDRVFVTTAVGRGDREIRTGLYGDVAPVQDLSRHSFELYALDREDGSVLWRRVVHEGVPAVKRHPKASQANSTPVTDGERIVVLFGSVGKLAAFDLDGEPLWSRDLRPLDSGWFYDPGVQWGHASSPVIHDGRVLVQADVQDGSFLAAFDVAGGEELWRTPRDEIPSWGTPAVLPGPRGAELVTNGKTIRGYDPATGELLWWLGPSSEVVVATPVIGDRVAYVTAGYPPIRPIYAVLPGGQGDLSLPEGARSTERVLWSHDRGGTYIPTPLLYRGLLYMNANNGRLTTYDAASGEMVYRARIAGVGGSYVASPVAADGRVYFSSEDGDVHVVEAGPEYVHVASNAMGEPIWATPAMASGTLIVRTVDAVYGLGGS